MLLDNRTRYRSADLERVILLALEDAGITDHRFDVVRVVYGPYTGHCYFVRHKGVPRMVLRIPEGPWSLYDDPLGEMRCLAPEFDFPQFVWLVRHEVAHWRGLEHKQMASSLRYWERRDTARNISGPVGSELPMPEWARALDGVRVELSEPPRKRQGLSAEEKRLKALEHAHDMHAMWTTRLKRASTLERKWRKRLTSLTERVRKAARSSS